ncbi:MAG: ABC transporter permease, partial [Alcanivoracaceae bacterium]|nr:ABC transporter permease [Alcanivoracaceae bacterium]
ATAVGVLAAGFAASGVIGPGTRYRHRTLIASSDADALETRLADTLRPDQELETVDNAALRSLGPLRQLTLWMSLAVLLVALLCGAALYLATGVRTRRRARTVALLRTFGASQSHVARRLLVEECAGALPVILAGCLAGTLVAQGVRLAFDLEPGSAAGWQHWLAMLAAPLLLFAGFVLPRIQALLNTPTLAVLNRNVQPAASATTLALAAALLTPMVLAALLTGSVSDSGLLVLALGLSGALLPLLAWPALAATSRVSHRIGSRYGMALRRLTRRPALTLPLVSALTISLAVLTLAALSGQALLEQWRQQLPQKAPNFFVINLFDQDLETLASWQERHGARSEPLYPIVRGRLTLINDAPVRDAVTKENDRAERALNRDLALTENTQLPDSNRVVDGDWHGDATAEVSVEERLADALQLAIGDRLSFVTSRGTVSATVTSIREVDWESFEPNFYFMFSPGAFAQQDVTWMTSFWLPGGDGARLAELMQTLPHITLLDVNAVLDKAQGVVSQASNAVIGLAGLLIAAALLVLAAALLASQQQRAGDQALLRALGASDALVRRIDLIEFCALAGMALVGALLLCAMALVPLAVMLFDGDLPLSAWLALPVPAAVLVIAVGMFGTRRARQTPALAILRQDA